MAMAGGRSWGEHYIFLEAIPFQYRLIFLFFLTFTMFAVLNIVTGVFVDSAMNANTSSRQVVIHEELDAKNAMLKAHATRWLAGCAQVFRAAGIIHARRRSRHALAQFSCATDQSRAHLGASQWLGTQSSLKPWPEHCAPLRDPAERKPHHRHQVAEDC